MKKEEIVAQISADMEIFLNEHPQMEFYALAFDCNTEYAEFLVCMNTEDDFRQTLRDYQEDDKRYCTDTASIRDLRYNPGDWEHTDISEIELFSEDELAAQYQDDIERQCAELLQLCDEILAAFRETDVFKRIPKTADFISFCIDHDEDPADALARAGVKGALP